MELKSGDVIGFLKLIEVVYKCDENRKRKYWRCECLRCGNKCLVREDNIKDKKVKNKSCGCLRKATRSKWLYVRSHYGS